MIATVVILIVLVQLVQFAGNTLDIIILSLTSRAPTLRRRQYEFSAQIRAIRIYRSSRSVYLSLYARIAGQPDIFNTTACSILAQQITRFVINIGRTRLHGQMISPGGTFVNALPPCVMQVKGSLAVAGNCADTPRRIVQQGGAVESMIFSFL